MKRWIVTLCGMALVLAAGSGLRGASEREVLFEAAAKRFKIKSAKLGDLDLSKDVTDAASVKATYVAMLESALAQELITKTPSVVEETSRRLLADGARLLVFHQKDGDALRPVIARRAGKCGLEPGQRVEVRYGERVQRLCLDGSLESPGGFDDNEQVVVEVHDPDFVVEDSLAEWEAVLLAAIQRRAVAEFLPRYAKTGRPSLL